MEKKLLSDVYNELGEKYFRNEWTGKEMHCYGQLRRPSGSRRMLRPSDLATKERAQKIFNKLRSLMNAENTDILIRPALSGSRYEVISSDISIERIDVPESYIISFENDWYDCQLSIKKGRKTKTSTTERNYRTKKFTHDKKKIEPLFVKAIGMVEGKLSYDRALEKLEILCLEKKIKCPKRDWLSKNLDEIYDKEKNKRI